MILGPQAGRVLALASILTMMIAYSASIAAACPGGGEEGGGRRLTASTSQFDFRSRAGSADITFRYSGPDEIRTIRGGAIITGREPEDYSIALDQCENERTGEGIVMRNFGTCRTYGVEHRSTRRSSALLILTSEEGDLISSVRLINS
jgi:hypothetical protein